MTITDELWLSMRRRIGVGSEQYGNEQMDSNGIPVQKIEDNNGIGSQ